MFRPTEESASKALQLQCGGVRTARLQLRVSLKRVHDSASLEAPLHDGEVLAADRYDARVVRQKTHSGDLRRMPRTRVIQASGLVRRIYE